MSTADDAVREGLQRLYPAADGSGVAEAVRGRVAAGDLGTPPPSGGGWSWLPWIGGAVVIGLVAGGAGIAGLAGHPTIDVWESAPAAIAQTTSGLDCPGGGAIAELVQGSRVLAVERTEDTGWIAVRDPLSLGSLWLPAESLVLVDGADDLGALPVGGCVSATVALAPTSTPTTPPGPTPTPGQPAPSPSQPPSQPAPDTTAPSIGTPTVSYPPGYPCSVSQTITIAVSASDDVGVVSVVASWSSPSDSGSAALSGGGGSWSLGYTPAGVPVTQNVSFTITATDAAGNQASIGTTVTRDQCPG